MATVSKEDWVRAGLRALRDGGIESVRVEPTADSLGVTKGSFYWHFENRQAWLDAMLTDWERVGTDQIIELVNAAADDPKKRLRTLMGAATVSDQTGDAIEARLRAWASTDAVAAAAIGRIDARRVEFVVDLLEEIGIPRHQAELRSGALYRILIGEYTWRTSGGPTGDRALLDEIVDMVTQPSSDI